MESRTSFDLETFLPYRLNRAAETISRAFQRFYRERHGLTRPEWRALAALGSRGSMTATQIGAHSFMHKTKVSRAVQSLEERRWLVRQRGAADRRLEHLTLTDQGQRAYREIIDLAIAYEQALERSLGETAAHALKQGLSAIEATMPDARSDSLPD